MTLFWRRRVAVVGVSQGGVSITLAMLSLGYGVRLYEKQVELKVVGGGGLLSVPVLAMLRDYGIDIDRIGAFARTVRFAFACYERARIVYAIHHIELARKLGWTFYHMPWPLSLVRDFVFDHNGLPHNTIQKRAILRRRHCRSCSRSSMSVNGVPVDGNLARGCP